MPSNVEIKAHLLDRQKAVQVARELSGTNGTVLEQEDTFFGVDSGRLKLREEAGQSHAKLISYQREDCTGPKLSTYTIATTETPEELKSILTCSLGLIGCVKKTRLLFLVGQTRVHIDSVQSLGEFLELEVVLASEQSPSEGQAVADALMCQLGVSASHLVSGAYLDLLLDLAQKTN